MPPLGPLRPNEIRLMEALPLGLDPPIPLFHHIFHNSAVVSSANVELGRRERVRNTWRDGALDFVTAFGVWNAHGGKLSCSWRGFPTRFVGFAVTVTQEVLLGAS